MSVKIRISYETDAEINNIIDLLRPLGLKVKMPYKKGERFLRAYLYDKNKPGGPAEPPMDIEQQYPI